MNVLLLMPLLITGGVGVRIESLRSELSEWPTPKLEDAVIRALEKTSKEKWAEHYLTVGDEVRADVNLKGVLTALDDGHSVRLTWKLETQNCPMLHDAVAYDFGSSAISDAGMESMFRQLSRRVARLFERAREKRSVACIDWTDVPSPEELELRRARAQAIINSGQPQRRSVLLPPPPPAAIPAPAALPAPRTLPPPESR